MNYGGFFLLRQITRVDELVNDISDIMYNTENNNVFHYLWQPVKEILQPVGLHGKGVFDVSLQTRRVPLLNGFQLVGGAAVV